MNPQLWWYVARSSGLVAWALLSAAVVCGLLVSTHAKGGRPTKAWSLDLHRFLAGASVIFTGLHLAGLVADSTVHFGPTELLVPLASAWKPLPVALGVVSLYLLAAVEGSSLLRRRLSRRWWRRIHLSSFVLFWTATGHLLLAGTDAGNPLVRVAAASVVAGVVFLTLVRVLTTHPRPPIPAGRPGRPHPTGAT
jgi:hypothetical protein